MDKKKEVYPETEDLTHQVPEYKGDVGMEFSGRDKVQKGYKKFKSKFNELNRKLIKKLKGN